MGRIVRRFARFYQQELRHSLQAGSEIVPLQQAIIDQRVIEASMTAFLGIAGTVQALFASVQTSVAMTGNLRAGRVQAMVLAVGSVTGDLRALYVRAVCRATGAVPGEFTGVFIELNVDNTVALTGDVMAIHIGNMMRVAPTGMYSIMRLDENGGALIDNIFMFAVAAGSDVTDLFYFAQNTTAWNALGDRIGAGAPNANALGWLRVSFGGAPQYIQLFA